MSTVIDRIYLENILINRILNGIKYVLVLADEPIGQNGPRATNNSVDAPDPRSPLGRVPPYQPPPAGMGVGPNPMNSPGFWPHGIYTRVEGWHRTYATINFISYHYQR